MDRVPPCPLVLPRRLRKYWTKVSQEESSTSLDGDRRGTEEVAAAVAVAIFPSPQPKTDDDCAFCDGDFDADRDRSDSCDDKKSLDVSFPNRW